MPDSENVKLSGKFYSRVYEGDFRKTGEWCVDFEKKAREKQIMEQVLAGKFNKVIADELNISMRTVEVHRANLFDKMQVKTAVELANLLKSGG
jgi:DNA-binding NarL/FixJ family response regulator